MAPRKASLCVAERPAAVDRARRQFSKLTDEHHWRISVVDGGFLTNGGSDLGLDTPS
jgi:hypothetical protein